jgi:hypothetical protein
MRKLAAAPANADHEITPLAQRPEYLAALRSLEELEKAYSEREAQRQRLLARARGQRTKRSVSERAADLVPVVKSIRSRSALNWRPSTPSSGFCAKPSAKKRRSLTGLRLSSATRKISRCARNTRRQCAMR